MTTNWWSESDNAKLKFMLSEGAAFSEIAAALDGRHSRNGCIGRAHRLGLENPKPRQRSAASLKPKRNRSHPFNEQANKLAREQRAKDREASLTKAEARQTSATSKTANGGLSIWDSQWFDGKPSTCRWPLNDASPINAFRMCGAKVVCGSYCDEHARASRPGNERMAEADV